ncbi:hypothetical protein E7744_00710 [Citricoccus sp. SGAir0253]|uniref:hypothetical protein n=1 Tax=Citricoccus sp. SGAir0253 TaxID=2567881 RepID=UPI0010CCFC84|nr:hypothetical protein [Citricoccus sp. SGAir0253]QCU76915.1 hypothetical protein E7744_00710 [Citricoccus sp. SGAir0253]
MVTIDTSALTQWESSNRLDELGMDLLSHTGAFRTTVDGLNGDWKRIDPFYHGAGNDELVNGLMPAVRRANQLANAGVSADSALLTLAERLRSLESDRSTLGSDVAAFHAAHGWTALDDLDSTARAEYYRLNGTAGSLQGRYETAIRTCVDALGRIRPDRLSGDSPDARSVGASAMTGVETVMFGALPGVIADTGTVRSLRQGAHAPSPHVGRHVTVFGRHIRFLDPVMDVVGNPGGAWSALMTPATAPGRHRSGSRAFGPPRHLSEAIHRHTLPSAGTPGMTLAQRARHVGGRFGQAFLDGLPIVGEARGGRTSAAFTQHRGYEVSTSRTTGVLKTGGRALGTIGTVFTATLTYREEREVETAQVAAENPELDRQQVEQRATENAVAGTAGRVGSTILASAAVGAAAGSVVPGPGNVVGFVAGLAAGIAMEVPVADVDGDGQRDSLSKMAGEGLKDAWDWVRGR